MHFSNGNDWDSKVVYACRDCGVGHLCEVCHRHAVPRGTCRDCPPSKTVSPAEGLQVDKALRRHGRPGV